MKTLQLDPGAADLLNALHHDKHDAYVVGGCVRDSLLGREPRDWDLCTSAYPMEMLSLFRPENCIPTGLRHGTLSVKYGGKVYEVTTFRVELGYSDSRHPDKVRFVPEVEEDLARRDFTINAMAYNERRGLVDPYGGQEDLARGVMRAVGSPALRFSEDALRILRLYRFAARFGFSIDPETEMQARNQREGLRAISVERITDELLGLLEAPKPSVGMEPQIFSVILPELFFDEGTSFARAKGWVDALPADPADRTVRLAALLFPLGEQSAQEVLHRLRCSNALTDETCLLIREAECLHTAQEPSARRLLGRIDLPQLRRTTLLAEVLWPEQAPQFRALLADAERLMAQKACCRVNQLALKGRELLALGVAPGPEVRQLLETLLEQVITDQTPNTRAALTAAARQLLAQKAAAEQEQTL